MSAYLDSRPATVTAAVIAMLASTALSVILYFIDLSNGIIDKGTVEFMIIICAISLIFTYKIYQGSKGWMYACVVTFIVTAALNLLATSEFDLYQNGGLGKWDLIQSILAGSFAIVQLLSSSSRRWLR